MLKRCLLIQLWLLLSLSQHSANFHALASHPETFLETLWMTRALLQTRFGVGAP